MDLGWATVRGRARWATVLGIVVALGLIGGSLFALDRSVLSFDGWSTESQPRPGQLTLPAAPEDAIDTGATGGTAAPGIPGTGVPLVPVLPTAGGGAGGAGTAGGTAGGSAGGTLGGTGGTGANG